MRSVAAVAAFIIAAGSLFFSIAVNSCGAQTVPWVPDTENGRYRNPVIFADYSDPDVCRKGDEYFLVSSSFNRVPGIPVLESRDLVNWRIIGHALTRLTPEDYYSSVRPGGGVWAPSIRYRSGKFFVYYPDPDFGIYVVTAKDPAGPWSEPLLVKGGKGLEDPCPFWDDDGRAYLIHAFAGSRAGIKSVLVLNRMSEDGTKLLDAGSIVYDGHGIDPTVEGPKLYKRHGYYYIFAPAGGVSNGWQVVLRSKNIYGPYERKMVLHQGKTAVNGPHQGAWIVTPKGESWFVHFQDRGSYGRVDYLEPMTWAGGWPTIGTVAQGDSIGQPVLSFRKPDVGFSYPDEVPQTSDEFNGTALGLQWQWQANPGATWAFPDPASGCLRLYAVKISDEPSNFWRIPNILTQKFPAESFQCTTRLTFTPLSRGDKAGLIILGTSYAYLALSEKSDGTYLAFVSCQNADSGNREDEKIIERAMSRTVYFRVSVAPGAACEFSYSFDGMNFTVIPDDFVAQPGKWVGASVGIFCTGKEKADDSGYADFDWFRVR